MFCDDSDISNYADDNSPFSCNSSTEAVILKLENDIFIEIQQVKFFNSNAQKLLGIKVDNKLSFDDHVRDLCNKASRKLHALARIAHYMQPLQKRLIMKAVIN